VVAPPSNHITGRVYEWATPPGVEPAEPPEWLMDLLRGPKHEHTPPPPDEQKKKLLGNLRPCFYAMCQGEGPAIHDGGIIHDARIALVAEAQYHRATIPLITSLFEGCSDFNSEITERAVKGLAYQNLTEGIQRWGCETIRERGWCPLEDINDCFFYRIVVKESTAEPPDLFFVTNPETGRKVFNPKKMSDYIQESHHFLATSQNSDLWIYHPELGIWKPDGSEKLHKICEDLLQHKWRSIHTSEVEKHVRHGNYVPFTDLGGPINKIVVRNGVLDLETRQLHPFSHELYAITALPIAYNPDARCPNIVKTLVMILGPDIATFQEWFGYHLYRLYPIHKCALFIGTGENGKTQLLLLITRFIGPENCSNVSLYEITTDRFASSDLYRMSANLAPDVGVGELRNTGRFKALTGEDSIRAQKKHRDAFDFYNYAKMSFACNQLPETPDNSDAFFRRFLPFKLRATFKEPSVFEAHPKLRDSPHVHEKVPRIMDKICTEEEMEGLLVWALKGLRRLLRNGEFTNAPSIEEVREYYTVQSKPVLGFVRHCLIEDPEAENPKDEVYRAYVEYCRSNGFVAEAKNKFTEKLSGEVPIQATRPTINGARIQCYKGVRFRLSGLSGLSGSKKQSQFLREGVKDRENNRHPDNPDGNQSENPNVDHLKRVSEKTIQRAGCISKPDFFNIMYEAGHPDQGVILETLKQNPRIKITDGGIRWVEVGGDE